MKDLFKIYAQMFVDPVQGFQAAVQKPVITALFPLVLVILGTTALNAYYYFHVDAEWLGNLLTAKLTPAQHRLIEGMLTPPHLFLASFVSVLILPAAIDCLRAFVFWVALKVLGRSTDYGSLFEIVTWSAMPLTLVLVAGVLNLVLSGAHVAPTDVNPVSLNRLVFHFPSSDPWSQFFATLTLVGFWEIGLHAVGLKVRTGISTRAAILLPVLPVMAAYGVWALILVGRSGS